MSIELGPLDLERLSIKSAIHRPIGPVGDTQGDRCGHNFEPLTCPYRHCSFRDLKQLFLRAEAWLDAHSRGKIEINSARGEICDSGYIASFSCIDRATGEESAATGFSERLADALASAIREEAE